MQRPLHLMPRRALLVLAVILASHSAVNAASLYTVTNLGQVNPNIDYGIPSDGAPTQTFDYLAPMTSAEQTAFQTGSFDAIAHPAQPGYLNLAYSATNDINWTPESGDLSMLRATMFTSNNEGVQVGIGTLINAQYNYREGMNQIAFFVSSPHSVTITPNPSDPFHTTTVQSPGYLYGSINNFNGTVSGINDSGTVVGAFTPTNSHNEVPFILPKEFGVLGFALQESLGSLGGSSGAAIALNDANQVVGWSTLPDGTHHAFLYQNGVMLDLNSLIPSASGIVLTDAVGINASGQIVAFGTDATGTSNEYLLTPGAIIPSPVPEPSTLAFFVIAGVGLALQRRRWQQGRLPQ